MAVGTKKCWVGIQHRGGNGCHAGGRGVSWRLKGNSEQSGRPFVVGLREHAVPSGLSE